MSLAPHLLNFGCLKHCWLKMEFSFDLLGVILEFTGHVNLY